MAVLPAGSAVPRFTLGTAEGGKFTQDAVIGERTLLVFYPFAFSPVCTDQLQLLDEVAEELAGRGISIVAVSTDASPSQVAFGEKLGVGLRQLSDFEPKGDASRAFGVYFAPGGMSTRALVLTADDGTIAWSWEGEHPGVMPPVSLILEAVADLGWVAGSPRNRLHGATAVPRLRISRAPRVRTGEHHGALRTAADRVAWSARKAST